MKEELKKKLDELLDAISEIKDSDEKLVTINDVRKRIHEICPLKHHPVDFVEWVKADKVEGNDYNPNSIPPPEMKLLLLSIENDGYTMPIVSNPEDDMIKIVDGFHRRKSMQISKEIQKSTMGYIPLSYIRNENKSIKDRMASTIRHNRARGKHEIDIMVKIIKELVQQGWGTIDIGKQLGMDADEVLRMIQFSGLPELYKDHDFSKSWS